MGIAIADSRLALALAEMFHSQLVVGSGNTVGGGSFTVDGASSSGADGAK